MSKLDDKKNVETQLKRNNDEVGLINIRRRIKREPNKDLVNFREENHRSMFEYSLKTTPET